MSDRPTPETESHFPSSRHKDDSWVVSCEIGLIRNLERQRDEALQELANSRVENDHNWQALNDLEKMTEIARELRDALTVTLTKLVGRMVPQDIDAVEQSHAALTKAKEVKL